jgi:hypothetical protein
MTAAFYVYYLTKKQVRHLVYKIEDKWWDLIDAVESFFTRRARSKPQVHLGADLEYADTLHEEAARLKRGVELGLDEDAIELSDALDEMQRASIADFNQAIDAAIAEFNSKGPVVDVTRTGEIIMNELHMELWRQEQLDQIRSLGAEFTEACRTS